MAETGRKGEVGGGVQRGEVEETDVQTEPQQRGDGYLSHINHAGNTPQSRLLVGGVQSSILRPSTIAAERSDFCG